MVACSKPTLRICTHVACAFAAAACLAAVLAACGGGGTSSVLNPHVKPALVAATTIPFASVGTPIPLPNLGGFTESITLPTNSEQQSSNLLNVLISDALPNGLPSPSGNAGRSIGAVASARLRARRDGISPPPSESLLYFVLSSNVTVTFDNLPSLSVTVPPSVDTSQNFYYAVYDPSNPTAGWQTVSIMTVSGNTLSFSLPVPGFVLFPNTTYGMLIYGVTNPTPAPVDPLFVSDYNGPSITEYAPGANGNAAPIAELAGGNASLYAPGAIAFDEKNDMFVDDNYYVTAYPAGAMGNIFPTQTIGGSLTGIGQSAGIAVDSSGDLYVANRLPPASILYFPAGASGNVAPALTITGPNTGLVDPLSLALDAEGNLYVGDGNLESVRVFGLGASGDVQPIRSLHVSGPGLTNVEGIAVDAVGDLFVATGQAIAEYPPGAQGNDQPSRVILGVLTQLDDSAVAVDSVGYIYAQDFNNNQVVVFSPTANGDVAPVRIIAGGNTQLSAPADLAVTPYFQIPGPAASP